MATRLNKGPAAGLAILALLMSVGICTLSLRTERAAADDVTEAVVHRVHRHDGRRGPRIGRDLFLWNGIFFILGLVLHQSGTITTFSANPPLFWIFVFIGLTSIGAYAWLSYTTKALVGELWTGATLGLFYLLGAAFYFYMPLASMTNPPMNWGYPRTWEGFLHALTRGQYERANPTSDPLRWQRRPALVLQ